MMQVGITIDGSNLEVAEGLTILEAAQRAGIYIASLCYHPDLPPFDSASPSQVVYQGRRKIEGTTEGYEGCQLCLVKIEGEGIKASCNTAVREGMVVQTNDAELKELRQANLARILSEHPHMCLVCSQQQGCDLKRCISNIPENERCCQKLKVCELRKLAAYIGISEDISPYVPRNLPLVEDDPLFLRDYNLCIRCTRCVRVCNDVMGVGALTFTTTFEGVTIGTTAATLEDSGCRFCGACAEVCPTGAINDKGMIWAERRAALTPCASACPAGIDVPLYVGLIAEGRFLEAIAVVREKILFAATLGRVCFKPCEDVCRRTNLDEAVGIRELKRAAAEYSGGPLGRNAEAASETGKKVAIVGSGPAGMTCGFYLARGGHQVTIFEALPEPGGMLRFGIPEYRLPRQIIKAEIEEIKQVGVDIKMNTKVESLDEIFEQGFDAVFLAIGLSKGLRMGIEGEDLPGVTDGISLLRDINLEKSVELGDRVGVVGGGNVALDTARSALRFGSKHVDIIYRRTRREMPAYDEEIEQALEEGVHILPLLMPKRIFRSNGELRLECFQMELGEPDERGRRRPFPISRSHYVAGYDNVIIAVGQSADFPKRLDLSVTPAGTVQIDSGTLRTSRKGVFAGGDVVSGPASVLEAIIMGKKAAQGIDQFLGGQGLIEKRKPEPEGLSLYLGKEEAFCALNRVKIPELPGKERACDFDEVRLGYSEEQAIQEAKRCLKCNLRLLISTSPTPPEGWLEFDVESVKEVPEIEGVFKLFDMEKNVIYIKGARNLSEELTESLGNFGGVRYFTWEDEPMYSKRETELLEQFMQQYGRLPELNIDSDDDLY